MSVQSACAWSFTTGVLAMFVAKLQPGLAIVAFLCGVAATVLIGRRAAKQGGA